MTCAPGGGAAAMSPWKSMISEGRPWRANSLMIRRVVTDFPWPGMPRMNACGLPLVLVRQVTGVPVPSLPSSTLTVAVPCSGCACPGCCLSACTWSSAGLPGASPDGRSGRKTCRIADRPSVRLRRAGTRLVRTGRVGTWNTGRCRIRLCRVGPMTRRRRIHNARSGHRVVGCLAGRHDADRGEARLAEVGGGEYLDRDFAVSGKETSVPFRADDVPRLGDLCGSAGSSSLSMLRCSSSSRSTGINPLRADRSA